ncbi:ankyrin repeat domain-containing protein [Streptomyces sp. BoleA5]|uniref:ankyrin repeat domain-containing protein n=1 Tax=Streptomyces sp. BoleA5 TaxID=1157637 RepID=UPI0018F887EB
MLRPRRCYGPCRHAQRRSGSSRQDASASRRLGERRRRDRAARGAHPSPQEDRGFTPLHLAAQESGIEAMRMLLSHGASVDQENRYGNTPLWTAVFNSQGRGDVIALLRAHGADPHRPNAHGRTPLDLARTIANSTWPSSSKISAEQQRTPATESRRRARAVSGPSVADQR